ncbi:MAG: hypothetical protein R2867_05445 [Caldilineaceae bacterium]
MRRFLVIDELQMMTAQSEFSDEFNRHLATLAQRGRKHGISLATATQDPSGANYPTYLQRNTKVAVAGQTKDDTYLTKYFKIQGASQLRGDGDFISSIHGSFKGFYMPESDITDTIDAICARYGESDGSTLLAGGHLQANRNKAQEVARHRQATMPSPLTPVATAMPRKTKQSKLSKRVERDAEAIAPYMDQAYDEANGRIRDGWAPTLIEAIYGEQKPNAGSYSNRLQAAIRCYNKT